MTSDLAVMKCYEPIVTFDILARSKITKLRLLQKCPAMLPPRGHAHRFSGGQPIEMQGRIS